MQFIDATRSIERQRFFDGQRLFASDLQAIEGFNREMRWLHNQSLHQPGVGNGFAVSGRKGDREVLVGAGYAIDDLGREIVCTTGRAIPVPPVADDGFGNPQRFLLTVQYPDDDDLEEVERRQGICDTDGAVRLREEPIFCWVKLNANGTPSVDQDRIVSGRQLVLAEAAVRDCKLADDISIVQRRNARPAVQPYVACGVAQPTPWRPWDEWADLLEAPAGERFTIQTYEAFGIVGGVQADIDTTSAGFHTTPDYFARIDGPRLVAVEYDAQDVSFVVDGLLSIVQPSASGFTAQVVVLAFPAASRRAQTFGSSRRTNAYKLLGGFDLSALRPDPDEFDEISVIEAAESTEDTTVEDVLRDWTVGWMGVEG